MSIQEFLRRCFYPRLIAKSDNREERTLGGIRSLIPQPLRREFLPKEYEGTEIWDASPRHPLLCSQGHYSWSKESKKTPSSFTIVAPHSLSTLRNKIEKGDYISHAHFKHHHSELDKCNCENGREVDEILAAEQRKAALANRAKGTPVLQDFDGVYELKFYVQNEKGELKPGIYDVDNVENKDKISSAGLSQKASLWMVSRDVGSIPKNCAGFLSFEDEGNKKRNLFIPDSGKIVLIIPFSKKEEYVKHLTLLKESLGDGVQMKRGKAVSLSDLENYRQGIIEWKDTESQEKVKSFIKKITNLELLHLRSTRPLNMEIFDSEYEAITPVSMDRKNEYALKIGTPYYIKMRRMRSAPLEGFRLLLGPGIDISNLSLVGMEATSLGVDEVSGGTVLKIFVRDQKLQNGLWAELVVKSLSDGAWIWIFDHGSSIEQSGMSLQIVSEDSI